VVAEWAGCTKPSAVGADSRGAGNRRPAFVLWRRVGRNDCVANSPTGGFGSSLGGTWTSRIIHTMSSRTSRALRSRGALPRAAGRRFLMLAWLTVSEARSWNSDRNWPCDDSRRENRPASTAWSGSASMRERFERKVADEADEVRARIRLGAGISAHSTSRATPRVRALSRVSAHGDRGRSASVSRGPSAVTSHQRRLSSLTCSFRTCCASARRSRRGSGFPGNATS